MDLIEKLKGRLQQPLPGPLAHTCLAPPLRHNPALDQNPPADARKAAVVLLLYCQYEHWFLPCMLRPPNTGPHSSQISLPGGQMEYGDSDLLNTATRELEEEFGINADTIQVLGLISQLYVAPSHFIVSPWVAWCDRRPAYNPDPVEVAEIIEIPLSEFFLSTNLGRHQRRLRGAWRTVPHFQVQDRKGQSHMIWGATAMIINELVFLLRESGLELENKHLQAGF